MTARGGWVYECIVTTYHEDGSPNAAPMGVKLGVHEGVALRVHVTTDTYRNIKREGVFCVNVVHDPVVFIKAAVRGHGKGSKESEFDAAEYGGCEGVHAPHLNGAAAFLEVKVLSESFFQRDDEMGVTRFANIKGMILKTHVLDQRPRAYNRGLGAAVELAIDLTRGKKDSVARYVGIMGRVMPEEEVGKIRSLLDGL